MRKERRKMVREDFNVLNDIFDTAEERRAQREAQERRERAAKEEADRCPTDVAGERFILQLRVDCGSSFTCLCMRWDG